MVYCTRLLDERWDSSRISHRVGSSPTSSVIVEEIGVVGSMLVCGTRGVGSNPTSPPYVRGWQISNAEGCRPSYVGAIPASRSI